MRELTEHRNGDIIENVIEAVRNILTGEGTGHDWQHISRVTNTAENLVNQEGDDVADPVVVVLSALCHDLDDRKLTGDIATEKTLPSARKVLAEAGAPDDLVEQVCETIGLMGFHKGLVGPRIQTMEAKIVSDADQLDAMGAIGVARAFIYGASRQRPMFEPDIYPMQAFTAEQYASHRGTTINHAFEKLLKLRDLMNTEAGKREGTVRHRRMVEFLDGFFRETNAPLAWRTLLNMYRT